MQRNSVPNVRVGDSDGWARFAMRCLGYGGLDVYEEGAPFESVKALQEALGIEQDGVIDDRVWAVILPPVAKATAPAQEQEIQILRRLVGLKSRGGWDEALTLEVGGETFEEWDALFDWDMTLEEIREKTEEAVALDRETVDTETFFERLGPPLDELREEWESVEEDSDWESE